MEAQNRLGGVLPAAAFTRKERLVVNDSGYYFKTREDNLMGPFPTEAEAKFELNTFIKIKHLEIEFKSISSSMVA